eukprot:TRINITY_DN826_c0_g2_i8.p2 TRINITY_DN826_c0_g2~~TRINITY_DN826_c0_g2_i8.p2  ORF type:complete len:132 (-),score=28.83 TRINITY_DN826_c0_g2_i8:56-451(-)
MAKIAQIFLFAVVANCLHSPSDDLIQNSEASAVLGETGVTGETPPATTKAAITTKKGAALSENAPPTTKAAAKGPTTTKKGAGLSENAPTTKAAAKGTTTPKKAAALGENAPTTKAAAKGPTTTKKRGSTQ